MHILPIDGCIDSFMKAMYTENPEIHNQQS